LRSKRKAFIGLYVDADLKDKLLRLAGSQTPKVSLSAYIAWVLERWIEELKVDG